MENTKTVMDRAAFKKFAVTVWNDRLIYLMMVPGLLWAFLFCYKPIYGIVVAFKDYSPSLGILGSPWLGFKHFQDFFRKDFPRVLRNTLLISVGSLVIGFPMPIMFAVLITGVKNKIYRKLTQTLSYVPHFVSWVVVGSICLVFFAPNTGIINVSLRNMGLIKGSIGFLENGPLFIVMLIIVGIWKSTGFSAIIYFAAIAGVDREMYEAAIIDGASKFQQTRYVTLPSIMPTVSVLLVLSLSGILNAGFEQQMVMANNLTWPWADVIDTYAYRYGLSKGRYSYGAAVGLFKSAVALIMMTASNAFVKRQTGYSLYK